MWENNSLQSNETRGDGPGWKDPADYLVDKGLIPCLYLPNPHMRMCRMTGSTLVQLINCLATHSVNGVWLEATEPCVVSVER